MESEQALGSATLGALDAAVQARPVAGARLEYIDGLRALAALWVVLHHTIETSDPTRALRIPIVGPVLASLFFGQFAVMIFLMLSGFCLYYPCCTKNPEAPRLSTSFGTYLKRRATRIAPPYLWACLFCIAFSQLPGIQSGRWTIVGPIDGWVILSHLLFVHNLIPSHAMKIDYPMWSIGLEWQLYLLFPLMVWAFRKSNASIVIAVSLLMAIAVRIVFRHLPPVSSAILRDGPFAYLEVFSLGMLAAALTVRGRTIAPHWLLGVIALAGFAGVRLGSGNGLFNDLATCAAAFCILMLAIDADSGVARLLRAPWLVRIGLFSYSLYLVHAPLIHLGWLALSPLHLSAEATLSMLMLLGVPIIIAVAYGFHTLFERPFMRV
jgi:peptidoglycan/LPS O-acetylase OafA/YrhL